MGKLTEEWGKDAFLVFEYLNWIPCNGKFLIHLIKLTGFCDDK